MTISKKDRKRLNRIEFLIDMIVKISHEERLDSYLKKNNEDEYTELFMFKSISYINYDTLVSELVNERITLEDAMYITKQVHKIILKDLSSNKFEKTIRVASNNKWPANLLNSALSLNVEYLYSDIENSIDIVLNNVLKKIDREVIYLYFRDMKTFPEIAKMKNLDIKQLVAIYNRALNNLRKPDYLKFMKYGITEIEEKELHEKFVHKIISDVCNSLDQKYRVRINQNIVDKIRIFMTNNKLDSLEIKHSGIQSRIINILNKSGINNIIQLVVMSHDEILEIPGIGSKYCEDINKHLSEFNL